jgi:adenosylhomocysteine nucleosidase
MLLIATALKEELETVLDLCQSKSKSRTGGIPVWTARCGQTGLNLVKLGVGPRRSAATLQNALAALNPGRVLITGYAGALHPGLKIADLVAVESACPFLQETWGAPIGEIGFGKARQLSGAERLVALGRAAGLEVHSGAILTMPCLVGAPEHKRVLFERFGAAVVDMETAALAEVADRAGIALDCIRVISDQANDDFFSSLSYHPELKPLQRAARTVAAGNWLGRYGEWRARSQDARRNLTRFLKAYLQAGI